MKLNKTLQQSVTRSLGYLSAALRVSTHPDAEAAGPRSHILGTISGFTSLGWQVLPFIVGDRLPPKSVNQGGGRVIGRNPMRILLSDLVRISSGIVNSYNAWTRLRGKVDWVYERYALLQSLGGRFKRHGIPWILESNGLLSYEAKYERKSVVLYRLARYIELNAYRNCDVLVCVNDNLKNIILNETGINSKKVIVSPNGVDIDFFSPDTASPIRVFEGFTIGYVGGVIPRQGLDLLIEVMADIITEGTLKDIFLVVVGDGVARSELEEKVSYLRLDSHVRFIGLVSRNEVPSYIAGFDVGFSGQVIQPIGKMYHSPLKIYEYMSMTKPVIASRFSDAQTVIDNDVTGFLFEPGDKESLKQVLLFAHDNRLRFPEMGRLARQEILQNHSWVSRVSDLIAQVEKIIAE